MSRKEKLRRKKIIRAYIARTIVGVILVTMLVLMFCGCLYIRDLFKKDNASQPKVDSQIEPQDDEVAEPSEDPAPVQEPEEDEPESYKQYPGISIVIDPGHGGNDGGTTSPDGTIIEKEINLNVSNKVASLLEKHGINVIMTRESDDYMSLEERAYFSSHQTANLFVSLHCNFFEGDESIDGLEAFYCKKDEDSRIFAESIVEAVSKQETMELRGATENNYYVTRHAGMDAILIEMGFLSNPTECAKLGSDEYQELLAKTIVEGILAAFDSQS